MSATTLSPTWPLKLLRPTEVEQFIECGFVAVRQAFSQDTAQAVLQWVWEKMGQDPHDRSTWTKPVVHLRDFLHGEPFSQVYTPRLRAAMDDLLGADRYDCPNRSGWWPVRFPGHHQPPWRPPTDGWHVDGSQFHHRLASPDQGLLMIIIFSPIAAGDGGTAISLGSHKQCARVLQAAEPQGLSPQELGKAMRQYPLGTVIEANGQPGDVFIHHPMMNHAASANCGDHPRIITNKCVPLREPLNFDPAVRPLSPVELGVTRALS